MNKTSKKVIGIGELLWDVLPDGKKLGGAPCNFVYHCQKQGREGLVLSAVGKDKDGMEILELLKTKGLSSELIQVNDKPTSTVDVALDENGVPKFTIHENVAWDFISYDESLRQIVPEADIVCFGTLAQRNSFSRNTIVKTLKTCKPDSLIVYDVNLRQNYYSPEIIENSLQLCNVLKLNEEELPAVCDMLDIFGDSEEKKAIHLLNRYSLKLVALTKGTNGSLLLTTTEKNYLPTPVVEVKDTVGAGDSFTAAMIVGFAEGASIKELHNKAVEISAFVCTQNGAMPEYYQEQKP